MKGNQEELTMKEKMSRFILFEGIVLLSDDVDSDDLEVHLELIK